MKCVFCGGDTQKTTVTFRYEEDDRCFLVEHVPAEVCDDVEKKPIRPRSPMNC